MYKPTFTKFNLSTVSAIFIFEQRFKNQCAKKDNTCTYLNGPNPSENISLKHVGNKRYVDMNEMKYGDTNVDWMLEIRGKIISKICREDL